MKKFGTRLLAAVVASSMVVMPVMAAPSVDDLKEDKAAKESEVKSLQEELNSIMTKLSDLEEDLISKGEEISQAEKDLEAAEEKEQEQYEAMKKRIKFMYEEGNSTALETLVTSENFSDLVNKAEYVQNVHTYDRNQLQEYVETKQEIADLKTTLEEDQQKMESMQAEYEEQEEDLNTVIASKQAEVSDLDARIQEAAEAAAREAEAQRQAQLQAQQAANNTNTGNTNSGNTNTGSSNTGSSNVPANVNGGTVVSRANSQLGKPYEWGACGPNSFDCSGFVSYCLTGSYTRIGTTMTFMGWTRVSNPQPGDVVTSATHCGIYIGGGQMIHAPHTGDVVKVGPVQSGMVYVRR
ncbi:MAG: coiled-coil domain-containing protein [Lachnospiraceae bacterium]